MKKFSIIIALALLSLLSQGCSPRIVGIDGLDVAGTHPTPPAPVDPVNPDPTPTPAQAASRHQITSGGGLQSGTGIKVRASIAPSTQGVVQHGSGGSFIVTAGITD